MSGHVLLLPNPAKLAKFQFLQVPPLVVQFILGDGVLPQAPVHVAGQLIYLWILTPERLKPISYTCSF